MEDQGLYAIVSTVLLGIFKLVVYLSKKKKEKISEEKDA